MFPPMEILHLGEKYHLGCFSHFLTVLSYIHIPELSHQKPIKLSPDKLYEQFCAMYLLQFLNLLHESPVLMFSSRLSVDICLNTLLITDIILSLHGS